MARHLEHSDSSVGHSGSLVSERTSAARQSTGTTSSALNDRGAAFNPRVSYKAPGGGRESKIMNEPLFIEETGLKGVIKGKCRVLSDNVRFNLLTTVLTIYALFGDDFRLLATQAYLDPLFDTITVGCISIFIFEIVVSSIGKDDYWLSFFCSLDVVSTATLVLDLTWIGNMFFCSDLEGGGEAKSSRAGRAGARAARTVRIIRLMRLVKLYAKYTTAKEEKEKNKDPKRRATIGRGSVANAKKVDPGQDADEDGEFEDLNGPGGQGVNAKPEKKPQAETRVGKKLGDMTTRRVIILVLTMLFIIPQFSPSSHGLEDFQSSMDIGMEMIYDRFRQYCPLNTTTSQVPWCLQTTTALSDSLPSAEQAVRRKLWEDFVLEVIYAHQGQSVAYSLYWIGLQSKFLSDQLGNEAAGQFLGNLGYLGQQRFVGTEALPSSAWNEKYANSTWGHSKPPSLSPSDIVKLTSPWTENCVGTFWGVPLGNQLNKNEQKKCAIEEDLRCSEVAYMAPLHKTVAEGKNFNILFVFNTRSTTTMEAGLSMLQTIFICLCVGLGAMTFSSDLDKLLLKPIERMIAKMDTIKDNPLEAMRLGDMEYRREEIENAKRKEQFAEKNRLQKLFHMVTDRKIKEPMETVILEKTIIKLGGLLALGFGEAGAEIIGHCMGQNSGVDAMLRGDRVEAIFGYCSIHNFFVLTKVLKEKVMIFVNQVGEIVHGCVDEFNGAANKNIGDSFLLIWRLSGYDTRGHAKLADMAIMSFVRIITETNKSPVLAHYSKHPGLLQHVPGFRVNMGYGLHCGWAVECAIGSDFKIDASYLSPNVNVARLLQQASADYGVWLLMSHYMMELCSKEFTMLCRLIDHVMVKCTRQPFRVFTIDLDYTSLSIEEKPGARYVKNRFKLRQIREVWKQEKWSESVNVYDAFETDLELCSMRHLYSPEFFRRFATAYRNYETGNWKVARDLFFTCYFDPRRDVGVKPWVREDDWPIDGPVRTLLKFMEHCNYKAPWHWPGYRYLSTADDLF